MNDTKTDLMRAIIESPDDDTPRLIFADWLEENGEEKRAEFIRVQIGLEKSKGHSWTGQQVHENNDVCGCSYCIFRRREQYLLGYGRVQWCPVRQCFASPHDVVYHRGFVESIRCPYQNWLDNWKELLDSAPIRKVTLTTRPLVERRGVADWNGADSFVSLQGRSQAWPLKEEEWLQDTETILQLLKWEWSSIKEWELSSENDLLRYAYSDNLADFLSRPVTNSLLYGTPDAP